MEKKNIRKVKTIITTIIAIILLLISITYAYISANKATNKNSVEAGTLLINYENDNLNTVNLSNIQPIYDKDIKEKASKISFKVNNTGTAKAYVDINITDIILPPELADLEFKWALYSSEEKINNGNFRNVLDNKLLLANNQEISSKGNKSYELYIWISENGLDQSDMMNKTFSGKITVVGHQKKQPELLSKIIKNNNPINNKKTNFNEISKTDEGLIQDIDDGGETYYFRGAVEDNYVKIEGLKWPSDAQPCYTIPNKSYIYTKRIDVEEVCERNYSTNYGYKSVEECKADIKEVGAKPGEDMLFRIVRINGDGTIRIVADGAIGYSEFNETSNSEKYVGYTYNNSKPNIQDGDSSTIKEYLDNWYETNMIPYDKVLASTRYCNDTSVSNTNENFIYYGAYNRIRTINTPTFMCPNTNKTYGGEYDLKIGLLSADETVFAGGNYQILNQKYYLYGIVSYRWLMSPYFSNDSSAHEFGTYINGCIDYNNNYYSEGVVPVLNLRADTLFTQGNGEKSTPYVIKANIE